MKIAEPYAAIPFVVGCVLLVSCFIVLSGMISIASVASWVHVVVLWSAVFAGPLLLTVGSGISTLGIAGQSGAKLALIGAAIASVWVAVLIFELISSLGEQPVDFGLVGIASALSISIVASVVVLVGLLRNE